MTNPDFASIMRLTEQYKSELHSLNTSWRRAQERLDKNFRVKWFIYRATIPVAIVSGISSGIILSDDRTRDVSNARSLVMWIAYHTGSLSYSSMGRAMNRDHSTVRHAVHVAGDKIAERSGGIYMILVDVVHLEGQWR